MGLSNYPPGMSRSDMDHVEGITRCLECGADISEQWEAGEINEADPVCPGGCHEPDYDAAREQREEADHFDRYGY